MRKTTPQTQSQAIARALEASRLAERERVAEILSGVHLRTDPSVPLHERFLAAELEYVQSHYTEAIAAFEQFEADPRSRAAPDWQRFASSHRRAFSYLHLGYDEQAEVALREAEERLRVLPEKERRLGDLDAMRGHLLVHQGDYERARARFFSTYERSMEREHWRRAATAAGDVATMHLQMGQLPEAKQWLDRAEDAHRRSGNQDPSPTILVRRGHIRRVEGKFKEANGYYTSAIQAVGDDYPDVLESALRGRAEARVAEGDLARAESDLRQAFAICQGLDNREHAAYAQRDLANLYIDRNQTGDDMLAIESFRHAMHLALALRPPQAGIVMDLAEEVLRRPALIGGKLSEEVARTLRHQTADLRTLVRPHPFAQTARAKEAQAVFRALFATFQLVARGQLNLKRSTINLLTGVVTTPTRRTRLTAAQLAVLKVLLVHPEGVTIDEISEALDIPLTAASRRTMRLMAILGEDLRPRRKRNTRLYALNIRETDEK